VRLVWGVLGYEILSVGLEQELLLEEEAPTGITGGSGACFERDGNPLNAVGEEPLWEDRGFGFR
jgi:hypothetical protein